MDIGRILIPLLCGWRSRAYYGDLAYVMMHWERLILW